MLIPQNTWQQKPLFFSEPRKNTGAKGPKQGEAEDISNGPILSYSNSQHLFRTYKSKITQVDSNCCGY